MDKEDLMGFITMVLLIGFCSFLIYILLIQNGFENRYQSKETICYGDRVVTIYKWIDGSGLNKQVVEDNR